MGHNHLSSGRYKLHPVVREEHSAERVKASEVSVGEESALAHAKSLWQQWDRMTGLSSDNKETTGIYRIQILYRRLVGHSKF